MLNCFFFFVMCVCAIYHCQTTATIKIMRNRFVMHGSIYLLPSPPPPGNPGDKSSPSGPGVGNCLKRSCPGGRGAGQIENNFLLLL